MRSKWKTAPLGDIVKIVIDYRGKTPKKLGGDWALKGIRALSAKNIKTREIVQHDTIRYVDNDMYTRWMKDEIQRGDILITSEAPFGEIFYWDSDEKIVLSQRLFAIRCKPEYYAPFVFHYMTGDCFQRELYGRATGTTVTGLRQPELLKCEISFPSYKDQVTIADTLSALDARIAENKKINAHLEQIAQAIFKSWFVDFEPFGGVMPDSWREGVLGDITSITSGKRPPYCQNEVSDKALIPLFGASSIMGYTNAVLFDEKILITGRVGTHGIIQRYSRKCWTSDNTLVIKSVFYEFVYQLLLNINFNSMNRGSTQPLITQTDLKNVPILLPDDSILKKFENVVGTLFNYFEVNILEVEKLITLRDTLLPRTMSGELFIADHDAK